MTAPALRPPSWHELLEAQDLVLSRSQALDGGLTDAGWKWRLTTRSWQLVLPGVALAHTGTATDRQLAWATLLHAGRGAALSGDAALVDLGMKHVTPVAVDVAVPHNRIVVPQSFRVVPEGRLRVHRVRNLERWVHPARELTVVRAPVAALHAAAWAPTDRAAEWRLAAAVQQRLVTPARLRAALIELPRLRRRALIRAVLDDVELGAHARSELDFLALLRRNHLPPPDRMQLPVRADGLRYLDASWWRPRVHVEVDGGHHRLVGTWDADTLRANEVVVTERDDGGVLLRFTSGNLRHDEPSVARQLAKVLL